MASGYPKKRLLCVIIDVGAAAYVRPLFEAWRDEAPAFEWRVSTSELAANSLGELIAGKVLKEGYLTRESEAVGFSDDVPDWSPNALLVSGGGWYVEHAHIEAARAAGIPSLQFIETWYGYKRRLTEGERWVLPTILGLIDRNARDEAAAEGVPVESSAQIGQPLWETIKPISPTRSKDVWFIGAPIAQDYGRTLGYDEADAWRTLQEVSDAQSDLIGEVYYAPHVLQPADSIPVDACIKRYNADLLSEFGTVVGCFSAPLVDAFLSNRRTITLQPHANDEDLCALSRQGYLPRTTTKEGLVAALSQPAPDASEMRAELGGSLSRLRNTLNEMVSP